MAVLLLLANSALALAGALRDSASGLAATRARFQRGLVVAQIAFTQPLIAMLAAALLLVFGFLGPERRTPDGERLVQLTVRALYRLVGSEAAEAARVDLHGAMERLVARLAATPGVVAALHDLGFGPSEEGVSEGFSMELRRFTTGAIGPATSPETRRPAGRASRWVWRRTSDPGPSARSTRSSGTEACEPSRARGPRDDVRFRRPSARILPRGRLTPRRSGADTWRMSTVYRSRRFTRYLAGALLPLCAACPQAFDEIRVIEVGDQTVFEMSRVTTGLEEGGTFELLDLTVTRSECASDCTAWSLVRADSLVGTPNLRTDRIDYGRAPPGMEHRTPAATLSPGAYTVSATVQRFDPAGTLIESLSLHGRFTAPAEQAGEPRAGGSSIIRQREARSG